MLRKLSITLMALVSSSATYAHQHAHDGAGATYAIDNPLRPGAKAPYCESQTETVDGCTFHSVAGAVYKAHLSAGKGETWSASTSDAVTIRLHDDEPVDAVDGKPYQVIRVEPNPSKDADTTVTFDRLIHQGGESRVVERRRINVMVHPG